MRRILVGLLLVFGVARPAHAQPAEVIIIRHAEKPVKGNELSLEGRERAEALAPYFLGTAELLEFKAPVAIYAPLPTHEHSSVRSAETVAPLAGALHLTINQTFRKDQIGDLVEEIDSDPRYSGKTVLICWEHKVIPDIAKAFGVEDSPKKWHGETFDRTWIIKFQSGAKPVFRDLPQKLMFGDSTN
jgi:hypothetical protein